MQTQPDLSALGFRSEWISAYSAVPADAFAARIARIERGHASVWTADDCLELDLTHYADSHDLAVGDWLFLRYEADALLLVQRLERYSCVSRRAAGERADRQLIAANLDALFIVSSCNADFSLERLERYLVVALEAKVTPVVVLTKADCTAHVEDYLEQARSLGEGIAVIALNSHAGEQAAALQQWCGPGRTVAMVGSSGVGKSTLTNQLIGDREAAQATQTARDGDAKGRHTTTSRSMHRLQGGGLIIDTPGMRELQLPGCAQGVATLFEDVTRHLGRCKFNDCKHQREPGCAITAAIASGELAERRWHSYARLDAEQAENQQGITARNTRPSKMPGKQRVAANAARKNKGKRARGDEIEI